MRRPMFSQRFTNYAFAAGFTFGTLLTHAPAWWGKLLMGVVVFALLEGIDHVHARRAEVADER